MRHILGLNEEDQILAIDKNTCIVYNLDANEVYIDGSVLNYIKPLEMGDTVRAMRLCNELGLYEYLPSQNSKLALRVVKKYSDTDELDKHGRWTRLFMLGDRLVADISKHATYQIKYVATLIIPCANYGNAKEFDTYEEASDWVIDSWDDFLNEIR